MSYTVKQGEIIYLDFDPQSGREQKGRRPALVISNNTFNSATKGLAMVCPITNTNRNWPLHIDLDSRTKIQGVIMCDQARILDTNMRNAKKIEDAPKQKVDEAIDIVYGIIERE